MISSEGGGGGGLEGEGGCPLVNESSSAYYGRGLCAGPLPTEFRMCVKVEVAVLGFPS